MKGRKITLMSIFAMGVLATSSVEVTVHLVFFDGQEFHGHITGEGPPPTPELPME